MPRPQRQSDEDLAVRPPIWIDGSQQPKFKLVAWVVVGQVMARRWLAPHLDSASAGLSELAAQIAGGRFQMNLAWVGRAQRFVPRRASVSAGFAGFAARIGEARAILQPMLAVPEPISYPDMIRRPASATSPLSGPARLTVVENPRPHSADVDATMQAIRALIHADPDPKAKTTAKAATKIVSHTAAKPALPPAAGRFPP